MKKIPVNVLGFLEYQRLAWVALFNPRRAWDQMNKFIDQARAEQLWNGLRKKLDEREETK